MNKILKNSTIFVLLVLAVLTIYTLSTPTNSTVTLSYTEFMAKVDAGEITEVNITGDDNSYAVSGKLADDKQFEALIFPDLSIADTLSAKGVSISYNVHTTSWLGSLLATLIPTVLIVIVLIFLLNQGQGGGGKVMQFGKSRAKLQMEGKQKTTFKDVAGVDEVREELEEVVEFLRDPRKFNALGARVPKGVLLYGPPGCGKTLLAKAVAGEAGVPFFSISGSDFVEMFVGVGASRVRDLFEQAKKHKPCIIFIDEIDAVGRQRGAGLGGGHDEREQTLNQLLVEMDGFAENEGIIVIAATNRPDILDPALLRPGRFDREVTVDAPDVEGRRQILAVHAKNKPLDDSVNLDVVARRTPGFTGADLANVLNEAALLAARRERLKISMEDMEQAVERVIAGPEKKSKVISEKEKRLVAYHEAGHAVVSYFLPNSDPLHKVSIIPRGRAGGYTLLLPKEDRNYVTKSQMLDSLVLLLGGRMAERLVLGDISTGAQNDLERATSTVREMITRYGMSDELGPLTFGRQNEAVFLGRDLSQERNYSEAIAYAIDKEARNLIDEAYHRAEKILSDHIDELHKVAAMLIEHETIEAVDFYKIMSVHVSASPAMAEAAEAALAAEAKRLEEVERQAQLDAAQAEEKARLAAEEEAARIAEEEARLARLTEEAKIAAEKQKQAAEEARRVLASRDEDSVYWQKSPTTVEEKARILADADLRTDAANRTAEVQRQALAAKQAADAQRRAEAARRGDAAHQAAQAQAQKPATTEPTAKPPVETRRTMFTPEGQAGVSGQSEASRQAAEVQRQEKAAQRAAEAQRQATDARQRAEAARAEAEARRLAAEAKRQADAAREKAAEKPVEKPAEARKEDARILTDAAQAAREARSGATPPKMDGEPRLSQKPPKLDPVREPFRITDEFDKFDDFDDTPKQ